MIVFCFVLFCFNLQYGDVFEHMSVHRIKLIVLLWLPPVVIGSFYWFYFSVNELVLKCKQGSITSKRRRADTSVVSELIYLFLTNTIFIIVI